MIIIKNKQIKYNVIFLLVLTCGFSFGMFISPSIQLQDTSEISEPKPSAGEITIFSPENMTYIEPDSGYYPATVGFESDVIGSSPQGWTEFSEVNRLTTVIDSYNGHKNVFRIYDNTSSNHLTTVNRFLPQTHGTIEYWLTTSDIIMACTNIILDGPDSGIVFTIRNGYFQYRDSSTYITISGAPIPQINKWYYIRIEFRCSGGPIYQNLNETSFFVYIDGIKYGEFPFVNNVTQVNGSSISLGTVSKLTAYLDAKGYSWDPNYNLGDNLDEGLLLSYVNTTTLDWQGYSLDGQTNKTIAGNTTIPMPADGPHKVQVFGNDSMGAMYESDLRYFTVNTSPPEITINSPTDSQIISSSALSYDISITGPYDSLWYALEGGTNYTATGLTGTIDQSAWSALSDAIITIDFYANNSAGMEGTAQVQVFKQTSEEPPPGIPGYDLYILLGTLSLISAIIIRKRVKS